MKFRKVILKTFMDKCGTRTAFVILKLNNYIRGEFTTRIMDPVVKFVTM